MKQNKFFCKFSFLSSLLVMLFFAACKEDGAGIGIIYDNEHVSSDYKAVKCLTSSVLMGPVRQAGGDCYLGSIIDPETGGIINAGFATQFHVFENYHFPYHSNMFPLDGIDHSLDTVRCDSVELRLYFTKYLGDVNNPMTVECYELDRTKIIREDIAYYTNTDLKKQFVNDAAGPLVTKTFSPIDYTISDSALNNAEHSHNVRIVLPRWYGSRILNKYYENPEYFRNSYNFIRNVCPGFFFRIKNGSGTMLTVYVTTLNLYFSYYSNDEEHNLSKGMVRFSATPEVLQCSQIENTNMERLLTYADTTYLKTPAGICTEMTLPVNDILDGHQQDSISKATFTLECYNSKDYEAVDMDVPTSLLLVRKNEVDDFFLQHKLADGSTSFVANYSSSLNSYTFTNIAPLIRQCKKDSVDENWNKVVIVPVKTSSTSDTYGNSRLTSVQHEMGIRSVRLVRGTKEHPIRMSVVYSKFQ